MSGVPWRRQASDRSLRRSDRSRVSIRSLMWARGGLDMRGAAAGRRNGVPFRGSVGPASEPGCHDGERREDSIDLPGPAAPGRWTRPPCGWPASSGRRRPTVCRGRCRGPDDPTGALAVRRGRRPDDTSWVLSFARDLEAACQEHGIHFTSIGPIRWGRVGPAAADGTRRRSPIHWSPPIRSTARSRRRTAAAVRRRGAGGRAPVARLAQETPLGFGNFRFCTIAECGPSIPFFPAAYHDDGPPRFIDLQAADDVRTAFAGAGTLDDLERRLGETLGAQVVGGVDRPRDRSGGRDRLRRDRPDAAPVHGRRGQRGQDAGGFRGRRARGLGHAGGGRLDADAETAPAGAGRVLGPDAAGPGGLDLAARTSAGLASVSELLLYSAVCGPPGHRAAARRRPSSSPPSSWTSRRWPSRYRSR